jgi:hypothetical protein
MTAQTFNPTPDVSSRYGAPMGRRSGTMVNLDTAERLQLQRVRLNSGGYDAGGAYWGLGQALWVAMDHTGETVFFRARDREAAKAHVVAEHDAPETVRFYR